MTKTLDQRVEELEKKVEKILDSIKRLIEDRDRMTVREAGRKGGQAKVPKGPAQADRAAILAKARAAKAAKAAQKSSEK